MGRIFYEVEGDLGEDYQTLSVQQRRDRLRGLGIYLSSTDEAHHALRKSPDVWAVATYVDTDSVEGFDRMVELIGWAAQRGLIVRRSSEDGTIVPRDQRGLPVYVEWLDDHMVAEYKIKWF